MHYINPGNRQKRYIQEDKLAALQSINTINFANNKQQYQ